MNSIVIVYIFISWYPQVRIGVLCNTFNLRYSNTYGQVYQSQVIGYSSTYGWVYQSQVIGYSSTYGMVYQSQVIGYSSTYGQVFFQDDPFPDPEYMYVNEHMDRWVRGLTIHGTKNAYV